MVSPYVDVEIRFMRSPCLRVWLLMQAAMSHKPEASGQALRLPPMLVCKRNGAPTSSNSRRRQPSTVGV